MKKNNKVLIIIGVILLNVLVLFMLGQSMLGKTSEYDKTLAEATAEEKNRISHRGRALEKLERILKTI